MNYTVPPPDPASRSPQVPPPAQLEGIVERLTFHSTESGYTVARVQAKGERELVTIVGSFPQIEAGQTLRLLGEWRNHPKYGDQFQVKQYQELKPATLTGIEKYLGSGLIKGVGPVTARRIVAHFGLETLEIIEHQIHRLAEVPGIAHKRIAMIQRTWTEQKAIKEVMLFLQGNGVSTTYAVKIFKHYGNESIAVVSANPYQLATDVYGIGFITADAIARNLGIAAHSDYRYRAGLVHVLNTAGEEGHCYLPRSELIQRAGKLLQTSEHTPDPDQVSFVIQAMAGDQELRCLPEEDEPCYAPAFYFAESNLAKCLQHLIQEPVSVDRDRVDRWIDRFQEKAQTQLSAQQREAVRQAAQQRLLILTGGPGTGKTFTTRAIVALWRAMGKKVLLASPTGRAAQRLAEMTGQEAKTIHRLLEFDPTQMGFKRHGENPLEGEAIVIDEVSMLDIFLANNLFKAIPPQAQILLVGDTDQLPSVGAGSVLQDLIKSQQVPVVQLTEVFRQAQGSQIIMNAHRINRGKPLNLERVSATPHSDCLWLELPDGVDGVQGLQDIVTQLLPPLGFSPHHHLQVLCPMTRGTLGTRNLNQVLQACLNPPTPDKPEIFRGKSLLRVGDRVIQQMNDYDREVFNGDLGYITAIDLEEQAITVQYGTRSVVYDYADLDEIAPAWAITIHKSQGSEFPVIVLPLVMQHYLMLSRNLFYTGLTRAKQLAILLGSQKAIGLAIRQIRDRQRYTRLAKILSL
ncbi:MAG: ATP-dependent RecD-like DNA helicase [Prochlorotrichaceae cyanobacterium]|jgi:exodeoxyribonuclease V alpha subunit